MPRPKSTPRHKIHAEARSAEELEDMQKAANERGFSFSRYVAEAVRKEMRGDFMEPADLRKLKVINNTLELELKRTRAELETSERAYQSTDGELRKVRSRLYGEDGLVHEIPLVELVRTLVEIKGPISRAEVLEEIEDSIDEKGIVDDLRRAEMVLIQARVISLEDGGMLTWRTD